MRNTFLYLLYALSLLWSSQSAAQVKIVHATGKYHYNIFGTVYTIDEKENKKTPLQNATIQLFSLPDTTFMEGATTNQRGTYSIFYNGDSPKLLLRISYIGMESYEKHLKGMTTMEMLNNTKLEHDSIALRPKALTMEEVKVVAELKKMYMSGDTLIYNTDAYKVSEGAVLLELVRKLPGVYIKDGRLMYQKKPIHEIKLNGYSFFSNNMDIALQNMPVSELQQLKIYDEQTEQDKQMGVDSGQRHTVMDMKTKRDISDVKFTNTQASATTKEQRYRLRSEIDGHARNIGEYFVNGDLNSLPGSSTFNTDKNFRAYGKKHLKKIDVSGEGRYRYYKEENETDTRSETYLQDYNLYSDSRSESAQTQKNWKGTATVKGTLPNRFTFNFRGNIGQNRTHGLSSNYSATFNDSPYELTETPIWDNDKIPYNYRINREERHTLSLSDQKQADMEFNLSHNWNKNKQNLVWKVEGSRNQTEQQQFNRSEIRYYQLGDSTERHNEFVFSPNRTNRLSTSLSYYIRLNNSFNIHTQYAWTWNEQDSERNLFNLSPLLDANAALGTLPATYSTMKVDSLSSTSSDRNHQHTLSVSIHSPFNKPFRFMASLNVTLQRRIITSQQGKQSVDTTARFVGFSPKASLEYHTKKNGILLLSYFGQTNTLPSATLLPITNNDNPLYIHIGNPNLKQGYTQQIHFNYSGSVWNGMAGFSNTLNDVSYKETYNEETGGRIIRPENINGNWEAFANCSYTNYWSDLNLSIKADYRHNNRVGYFSYASSSANNIKRTMKEDNFSGSLSLSYQTDRADFSLSQEFDYNRNRDKALDRKSNTKNYRTIAEVTCRCPYNIILGSNATMWIRKGYALEEANHSELIWNLSAKYQFLKNKQAEVKVEFYDLLKRQSNISRSISAFGYTETNSYLLNSYGLITFSYRFNLLN